MKFHLLKTGCSTYRKTQVVFAILLSIANAGILEAEAAEKIAPPQPTAPSAPPSSSSNARSFYQVLDEVLSDFEYDLKKGAVVGLKDLSVRNVVSSENVPPSFKNHLELLVAERILKTTKNRIVHCLACRSKRASLKGDQVTISSPDSNAPELQRIAKMNGVQSFMDVAFAYQPNGMLLSLQVADVDTGTVLWSKTYNSESTRAAAQHRGVDFQELEDAKSRMEYQPTVQYKPTLYTVMAPKAGSGYSTSLALGFRMVERYDNRHKEVGFEVNSYFDIPSLTGSATTAEKRMNVFSGTNLTLLFVHGWALFGNTENYNNVREMVYAAIGGTYASGFLGGVIRGGYEWRLAKHWSVTGFLGYRPKATLVVSSGVTAALSGVEGGVGVGFIF